MVTIEKLIYYTDQDDKKVRVQAVLQNDAGIIFWYKVLPNLGIVAAPEWLEYFQTYRTFLVYDPTNEITADVEYGMILEDVRQYAIMGIKTETIRLPRFVQRGQLKISALYHQDRLFAVTIGCLVFGVHPQFGLCRSFREWMNCLIDNREDEYNIAWEEAKLAYELGIYDTIEK